jgi:hypothetical protein
MVKGGKPNCNEDMKQEVISVNRHLLKHKKCYHPYTNSIEMCFLKILRSMNMASDTTTVVVVVVLVVGPISTAAMKAYCTLTPQWSSVIHLQRRCTPSGVTDLR